MDDSEELKLAFTGSLVEATFIKSLLEENGIGALVRNTMEESFVAGWASGGHEDSSLVYVAAYNLEDAKKLVEEYLQSRKNL